MPRRIFPLYSDLPSMTSPRCFLPPPSSRYVIHNIFTVQPNLLLPPDLPRKYYVFVLAMKSVSFLWKKKDSSKPPGSNSDVTSRPRYLSHVFPHLFGLHTDHVYRHISHTLPRSVANAKDIQGLQFFTSQDLRASRHCIPEHFENARQRSQSMGTQNTPLQMTPHPHPSFYGTPSERSPKSEPPFVARPPRKSSLVPISDPVRLSASSGSESPNRPPLTRESSALSLQLPAVKTLKAKRSMPELQVSRTRESWVEEADDANVTPTRREFGRDVVRGINRQRLSLKQRLSDLPESPALTMTLPSLPGNTSPVVDLSSQKSHFGPLHPSPRKAHVGLETTGNVHFFTYPSPKDDSRFNTSSLPEDPRSNIPMSTEVTLSMFPQPPPLTIRHRRPSRPTSPSQYPITPDYSPSATPTSPIFPLSNHHQSKRTSILKKSSSFYDLLPSPPITPNSSFTSSRSGSNGSLSKIPIVLPGRDPISPTLRIRASSPYLPSATPTLHTVHRSSSSDSSSDKPAFPGPSSSERHRMEQRHMQKRIMSRPPAQRAVFEASLPEPTLNQTQTPHDTRPVSPETVQWGYAV